MEQRPPDHYREIAAINQQPIYLPNDLGMQRMKWVYGILVGFAIFLIGATWTVAIKFTEMSANTLAVAALKIDSKATRDIADENKRAIESRRESYESMLKFWGAMQQYKFADWYEQHRQIYEMMLRGESFRAKFYRDHGYPAPELPEK